MPFDFERRQASLPSLDDRQRFPKPKTPEDAVRNGVLLLDRAKPNWRHLIRKDVLNLDDVSDCVLGQLYRRQAAGNIAGYYTATQLLGFNKSRRHPGEFGFCTYSKLITEETLKAAWLRELS